MDLTASPAPAERTLPASGGRAIQGTARGVRHRPATRTRRRAAFGVAAVLCAGALVGTVVELVSALHSYRHLVPTVTADHIITAPVVVPDFVSINASRGLDSVDLSTLADLSTTAGMPSTVLHQGTLDLSAVQRDGTEIITAPAGAGFPMSTMAVDPDQIAATTNDETAETLRRGLVVVGATAAAVDRLQIGDTITLLGWNGVPSAFEVGAVEPDEAVAGVELVLSLQQARTVAFDRPFSVRMWGFSDRGAAIAFEHAVATQWTRSPIRVRSSWVDPLFDDTVTQARIKQLLGQFWVRRGTGSTVQVDPVWKLRALTQVSLPIIGTFRCHPTVAAAADAALAELRDAGLAALIHVADTRRSGGCFSARVTRSLSGSSGRNLSRHTWGAAIDLNPTQNRYGGTSRMDPRVIAAFTRHGFVWGGTFLIPDPMHFEYVGAGPTRPEG